MLQSLLLVIGILVLTNIIAQLSPRVQEQVVTKKERKNISEPTPRASH
ncbi:MAG TPA: hypothetical protein VIT44_03030 [Cyclobacteriaceae bacterium]